jgi:hypothetical protein
MTENSTPNQPKVLVASLLCDRKSYSQNVGIPPLYNLKYPNYSVYLNIESKDPSLWNDLDKLIEKNQHINTECDVWQITESTWWKKPGFDQDQARLFPICIARNMAIDCAMLNDYDYIFFVDADVIVPRNSLELLMAEDRPIISGTVPGRGAHNHAAYIFHPRSYPKPGVVSCAHSTCGFTLIKREVFQVLRFRQGPHPIHTEVHLSEDPAYGADMEQLGFLDINEGKAEGNGKGSWWVLTNLLAAHMDDPDRPLTKEGISQF